MGAGAQLTVTELRQAARHPVDYPVIAEHRRLGDVHLHITNISAQGFMVEGAFELGRGERAAITRALAIGAGLLTDDQEARLHAQSLQLLVVGTLGLLVRGKRVGLLASVAPLIQRLRDSGQRFGNGVVHQALAAAGEATA